MVAYSFKPRFEFAVREGWKTQTIRRARDRHARPGELLQLFVGMRTAQCRKICPDVRCTAVMKIVISFDGEGGIERIIAGGQPVADLDAFAQRDGFEDADDMSDFWRAEHGPVGLWHGVLIEWSAPKEIPND